MNSVIAIKHELQEIFNKYKVLDFYVTANRNITDTDLTCACHVKDKSVIRNVWESIIDLYPFGEVYTSTKPRDFLYNNLELVWSNGAWLI